MFDIFFKSEFFEKKFYWLRKNVGFFNKQYMHAHQLGRGFKNSESCSASQASLNQIKKAVISPHEPKIKSKKIWLYWNSALDEAPEVVRLSFKSWEQLNPEYKVVLLNDESVKSKLGFDFNAIFEICNIKLTLANKADLLRLYLLSRYGGVWVDATTFCIKPLEEWLPYISYKTDFFAFRQNKVKSRPIEVWFMYADKGSPIIRKTLNDFVDYLTYEREVSLYVSNSKKKMRKLGVEKNHPDKLYANIVYKAEKFGFMPYFSLAYFLNESMHDLMSEGEIKKFFDFPNHFANNEDDFDVFENSYVSKQTYKGEYQSSNIFMERKKLLFGSSCVDTYI